LSPLFPDANTALTAWNVIARIAAGILIVLLAFSATDGSARADRRVSRDSPHQPAALVLRVQR
jgi:hypothetical protein